MVRFLFLIIIAILASGCSQLESSYGGATSEGASGKGAEAVPADSASIKFSYEDVEKHNSPDSCYIILEQRVYDVTDYLDNYPEFSEDTGLPPEQMRARLASSCGSDATDLFEGLHGDDQMRLDTYYLGDIE